MMNKGKGPQIKIGQLEPMHMINSNHIPTLQCEIKFMLNNGCVKILDLMN